MILNLLLDQPAPPSNNRSRLGSQDSFRRCAVDSFRHLLQKKASQHLWRWPLASDECKKSRRPVYPSHKVEPKLQSRHPTHGLSMTPGHVVQALADLPRSPAKQGLCPSCSSCVRGLGGASYDAQHALWSVKADYINSKLANEERVLCPDRAVSHPDKLTEKDHVFVK